MVRRRRDELVSTVSLLLLCVTVSVSGFGYSDYYICYRAFKVFVGR